MNLPSCPKHYGTSYAAVRYPGHNLWPLKLATHLYRLANTSPKRLLLTLHTRTPVTSIAPHTPSEAHPTSSPWRWALMTPRGPISCDYIVHATNAHASHLLPHMAGPRGIVPTRGQCVAIRANADLASLTKSGWAANDGFEYWFPRPVSGLDKTRVGAVDYPLVILGGGREMSSPRFETYEEDDGAVNEDIGRALRRFLPHVFPEKFEQGREPEMEWVSRSWSRRCGSAWLNSIW